MKLLYQKSGGTVKVCSARCYDAVPNSRCACICGGQLHAIGEEKALEKLRENSFFWGGAIITRRAMRAIRRMQQKKEGTNEN